MATSGTWNDIPDIALIYIYSCLTDTDKLNVATTCKNWNRLFSTAALWRKRRVKFSAVTPELTTEKEIKFLDKFGHCLNKLSLNLGRPTCRSCMEISKAVECYLQKICSRNDINIRELDLESLHMEQHWHFILSRNRVITALCKMIRRQKSIEAVYMAGARMRLVDGCRVLEALAKGRSRNTIKSLYLEDFFETSMVPFRHQRYVSAMSKFSVLEELHINYRYLSAEVIRNIANKLSQAFENLSVVLEGDVRGLEIPSDAWMEFTETCPLADVGAYLCTTILRGNDLRPAFVRGIPLNQIYLTSWARIDETEQRLSLFLRHLGNMYNTTLENFAMFFEHHEHIDADLLYMLKKCRRIKDLCIQAHLSADTVVAIMKLQYKGKLALKSLNLTVPGLSNDDWRRIEEEKERLLVNVTDFTHVGPTEFGSSIGGSTVSVDADGQADDFDNGGALPAVFDFRLHDFNVDVEILDDENDLFRPRANNPNDDEDFLI